MRILFWSLSFFCISFLMHFIIWKIYIPKRQLNTLCKIFLISLPVYTIILTNLSRYFWLFAPRTIFEYVYIWLVYISLFSVYFITYPAIEVDSPSLIIIKVISDFKKEGITHDGVLKNFNDNILVESRIGDLLRARLVDKSGDKYGITNRGRIFISVFIFYRRLLKIEKGG